MKNKTIHKDADLLLAHVLGTSREYILAHPEIRLSLLKRFRFQRLLRKREAGIPLAYLTGHKEFFGLDFLVNKHVLIPRPDTEILVEAVLETLSESNPTQPSPTRGENILLIDVGTGSGCIPISIMKTIQHKNINALGTDISRSALRIAKKNAKRHHVHISFLHSNVLPPSVVEKKIFLTANLPYLTESQFTSEPSIQHEPKSALVAADNGLALYKELLHRVATQRSFYRELTCFFEIDPSQTEEIKKEIHHHFPEALITIKKDLAGLDRVVLFSLVSRY